MGALVARAAQCALEVQTAFSANFNKNTEGMGSSIRLRVAIAAGEFKEYFLGVGGATTAGASRVDKKTALALVEKANGEKGRISGDTVEGFGTQSSYIFSMHIDA
eukprot:tig00020564_g11452.t1